MSVKISEYPVSVVALADEDLFDVSKKISSGPDVWESEKCEFSLLKSQILNSSNLNSPFLPYWDGTKLVDSVFYNISGNAGFANSVGTISATNTVVAGNQVTIYTGKIKIEHASEIWLQAPKVRVLNELIQGSDDKSYLDFGGGSYNQLVNNDGSGTVGTITLSPFQSVMNWTDGVGIGAFVIDTNKSTVSHNVGIILDAPYYNYNTLTASRVPYLDASKNLVVSSITPTELGYSSGLTSNIQGQLNNLSIGIGGWKSPARVACSTNITIASPGASLDSISMVVGDRVLLKAQSTASQNGVYVWNGSAVPMTRATDCATGDVTNTGVLGMVITIEEGTFADQFWVLSTNAPITIGVTSLTYIYGSATTYTGSNGVLLTGNNFTIDNTWFGGDATVNSSGVIAIGTSKVTNAMLAGSIAYSKLSLTNSIVSGDIVSLVWSKITSTPTTLSGYGITDAQPIDADLTAIAALSGSSGFLKTNGAGTWTVDTSTYLTTSSASSTYAPIASPTFTGIVTLGQDAVSGLQPISYQQFALGLLGRNDKEAAKYATTAALPAVVYNNGSSGVGATLTAVSFGALSFDGSTPTVGQRVLVKNQVSDFQNGPYTVTVVGGVATLFVLTRATDFNQASEIETGATVFITSGATLGATTWVYNGIDFPVMGTDAITFVQTTGQGSFIPGNGILISGTTISIDTSVTVDKTTVQALTNKTYNGNTWTAGTGTLTISASKTLTINQNLTLDGATGKSLTLTDSVTHNTNSMTVAGGSVLTFAANKNVTFADAFVTSGANSLTLTTMGVTNVTFPTSGTLSTLAGAENLTNKTGNISQWTNDSGYALNNLPALFIHQGSTATSPADTTPLYLGTSGASLNTTLGVRNFKIIRARTLSGAIFDITQGTNGSNETVSVYLRNVTTSTDTLIGTFTSDFGANTGTSFEFTFTPLVISTLTDFYTFKIVPPAWATNPASWTVSVHIY